MPEPPSIESTPAASTDSTEIEPLVPAPRKSAKQAHGAFWLGLVVLVLVVGWTAFSSLQSLLPGLGPRANIARVGQRAPDIHLRLLENGKAGRAVSLGELEGKPVVINFWASWCDPCRQEFPAIEAKYRQYHDSKGLVIIGIDSQGDMGPANAQQFIDKMGSTYPVWLDEDSSAEDAYRVNALPTTVFIDRNGVIQDLIVGGPISTDYIERELQKIF